MRAALAVRSYRLFTLGWPGARRARRVKQLLLQGMHDFASELSTMQQVAEQGVPVRVLNRSCLPETGISDNDHGTGRTGSDKAQMLHLKPGRPS